MKKVLNWCKQHKIWTGVIILVLLIGVIGSSGDTSTNTEKTKTTQSSIKSTIKETTDEIKGTYTDYNNVAYTYAIKERDGKHSALFQPVLPRDDTSVIGAMYELINTTYGKNTITNLTPQAITKDGQNLITLEYKDGLYYFLLVKEETGEVNSISYWNK